MKEQNKIEDRPQPPMKHLGLESSGSSQDDEDSGPLFCGFGNQFPVFFDEHVSMVSFVVNRAEDFRKERKNRK